MYIRFQSAMAPADVELAAYARRSLLLRLQHHSDRAADRAGRLAEEQVRQAGSPQARRTEAVAA